MDLDNTRQQLRNTGVDLFPRVGRMRYELGHDPIPDGRRDVLRRSPDDLVGVRL